MTRPEPRTLYTETLPVEFSLNDLDLDVLRRRFAEVFDRAAHAVQLAGFEQDDAIIERYVICRLGERTELAVTAESLSDRERLSRHVTETIRLRTGPSTVQSDVRIVGLKVEARIDITSVFHA